MSVWRDGRIYAIAIEVDESKVRHHVGQYDQAIDIIRRQMSERGFPYDKASGLYVGTEGANAVSCVLAAQGIARNLPWFREVVKSLRMLRIEEQNDLSVLFQKAL